MPFIGSWPCINALAATVSGPARRGSAGTERCRGRCMVVDSRRSGNHNRKPNKDAMEPNRLSVLFASPRRTNRGSFDRQTFISTRRVHHMKRIHILLTFFALGV